MRLPDPDDCQHDWVSAEATGATTTEAAQHAVCTWCDLCVPEDAIARWLYE